MSFSCPSLISLLSVSDQSLVRPLSVSCPSLVRLCPVESRQALNPSLKPKPQQNLCFSVAEFASPPASPALRSPLLLLLAVISCSTLSGSPSVSGSFSAVLRVSASVSVFSAGLRIDLRFGLRLSASFSVFLLLSVSFSVCSPFLSFALRFWVPVPHVTLTATLRPNRNHVEAEVEVEVEVDAEVEVVGGRGKGGSRRREKRLM